MTGRPGHASTVPGASLSALLTRRHEALVAHGSPARKGEVHGVHQARVASRRLREAVPILAAGLDDVRIKPLKRRLRDLTRALGAVRELDVALGMVEALPAVDEARRRLLEAWAEQLVTARRAPARALRKALARHDRDTLDELLGDLIAARRRSDDEQWRQALARRLASRARALSERIERTGALYHPEPLHDVRIAGKKLRYVLELAAETDLAKVARALRTLKSAQEALGHLHDLDVLLASLRGVPQASDGETLHAAATRVAADLEHESRLLHARYLRSRVALLRVTELAGTAVVRAVRGRRPSRHARQEQTHGR